MSDADGITSVKEEATVAAELSAMDDSFADLANLADEFVDAETDAAAGEAQPTEATPVAQNGEAEAPADASSDDDILVEAKKDKKSKKEKKKEKKEKKDKKEKKKKRTAEEADFDEPEEKRPRLPVKDEPDVPSTAPVHDVHDVHATHDFAEPHLSTDLPARIASLKEEYKRLLEAHRLQQPLKKLELSKDLYKQWRREADAERADLVQEVKGFQAQLDEELKQKAQAEVVVADASESAIKALLEPKLIRRDAYKLDNLQSTNAAQALIMKMDKAQLDDFDLMLAGKPTMHKLKLLPLVEATCRRAGYQEALITGGLLKRIESWLRAPPGQLPTYPIRTAMLALLLKLPYVDDPGRCRTAAEAKWSGISKEDLMETKLGVVVKVIADSLSETQDNRKTAKLLLEKFSRLIFNLCKNYKDLEFLEKEAGRVTTFKPDPYVVPADVKKYTRDGERVYSDKNKDGEPVPTRCRMPSTMMADFVLRPPSQRGTENEVPPVKRSAPNEHMARCLRNLRSAKDRAVVMSIEGSATTLKAEDR